MQEEPIKTDEVSPASLPASPGKGETGSSYMSIDSQAGDDKINPIEEAKKVLEESKRVLEETKRERMRIEKATAEMLVNGRSYAGQAPARQETADEKWAREAKLRYAGTGMCPC